jgi:hypothetical protein
MKKLTGIFLVGFFLLTFAGVVSAQEPHLSGPPKVLTITREWVKPGKIGATHEKTESLFVQAFARAKWPTHYLGMESISGKSRALFFTGYDSFDAYEKDTQAQEKNDALSAALAHAYLADGELLDAFDQSAWFYSEEQSYNAPVDLAHIRYFEIERFQIRQGHEREWAEGVKMVKAAYAKALPDAHWAMYSSVFGIPSPTYIVITPLKSAAEIDQDFASNSKFVAAMGEDGMKHLAELSAAAIEASETNLFVINPKMSYPREEWVKADPDFWKPKASGAPKKSAEKPKP